MLMHVKYLSLGLCVYVYLCVRVCMCVCARVRYGIIVLIKFVIALLAPHISSIFNFY